jgi:A/G-specific adenine glycosylase
MFEKLIQWSEKEFSYLPWRKNRSLYRTLVSEIMLQQTTVGTVLNHFEKFIKEYPAIEALAMATEDQLLISWKGLGYYRRAKNLKKAAEYILKEFNGEIPLNYETLISIPGIGDYTANALLAIGANENSLALDANLERVIARFYALNEIKGPKLIKKIKEINALKNELHEYGGRKINEALMDLGRNYCQARKASCDLCFLRDKCQAYKNKNVLQIPRVLDDTQNKLASDLVLIRIILKEDQKILAYQKNEKQWLSGQFEVPTFTLFCNETNFIQYPKIEMRDTFNYLPEYKTGITRYKIINKVLWLSKEEFQALGFKLSGYTWVSLDDSSHNLSTASIKAINL